MKRPWWTGWTIPVLATVIAIVGGFVWVLTQKGSVHDTVRYGQVDIPGTRTVALPAGTVDLILESDVDEGISLPVPARLTATVTPAAGGAAATVTRDQGGVYSLIPGKTQRVNGLENSYRRVWSVDVPSAGEYRVTAGPADLSNPNERTLDVGNAPSLGDAQVWERVGMVWLAVLLLWGVGRLLGRRSQPAPAI